MILQQGEYKIQDDGIWIKKSELEKWGKHYLKVARETDKKEFVPYYIGKNAVLTDLLKMFDDLDGE